MKKPSNHLQETLEELFFDYHVRGCMFADKKTNKMCNELKNKDIERILQLVASYMEETIQNCKFCPCDEHNCIVDRRERTRLSLLIKGGK